MLIQKIKSLGIKAGLALNPATPLDALDYVAEDLDFLLIMTVNPGFAGQALIPATIRKIREAKELLESKRLQIDIQVDGNVSFKNIKSMVDAGATMLVGGTSHLPTQMQDNWPPL